MMFQSYALFPHLNVRDNIAFGLRRETLAKAEIGKRVEEAMGMLATAAFAARKPQQLSSGQQQRGTPALDPVKIPRLLTVAETRRGAVWESECLYVQSLVVGLLL